MEKSWNFVFQFLWEPCFKVSLEMLRDLLKSQVALACNCNVIKLL